jgi:glycosyltransferase involved in cell wall biosynthesis
MIARFFPPYPSVASNRTGAFARWIDSDKYRVTVMLPKSDYGHVKEFPDFANICLIEDRQWLRRATFIKPASRPLHIVKAGWNRLFDFLGFSDLKVWEKNVAGYFPQIFVKDEPTVILSSFPPAAVIRAAYTIKGKFPEVKWIADLRDAIADNPYIPAREKRRLKATEELLALADVLVSVSQPICDYYRNQKSYKSRVAEIRNGFDFEPGNPGNRNDVFTITYAGTFYGKRNPDVLFRALSNLLGTGQISNIRIRMAGVGAAIKVPQDLSKFVEILPKMPYSNAITLLKQSDALLLVLPPGKSKGVYSGKLFDYLGTYRPVVAMVDPDDVAAILIRACKAGYVAEFGNIHENEEALMMAYRDWLLQSFPDPDRDCIAKHHRRVQTGELDRLIQNLWHT